ncbi:MAG: 4a-hydroxytetrahydrobiopterin dehydratase [Actinomycetes bacterium]
MGRRDLLTSDEVADALAALPGWSLVDGRLHTELTFADFAGAFAFMTAVAAVAEELDHHPDWSNVWNRVTVDLWTHDQGGLTGLDLELATRMAALVTDATRP